MPVVVKMRLGCGSEWLQWGGDGKEVGSTRECLKGRLMEEHWHLNHAEWRLTGYQKAGMTLIGLRCLCRFCLGLQSRIWSNHKTSVTMSFVEKRPKCRCLATVVIDLETRVKLFFHCCSTLAYVCNIFHAFLCLWLYYNRRNWGAWGISNIYCTVLSGCLCMPPPVIQSSL